MRVQRLVEQVDDDETFHVFKRGVVSSFLDDKHVYVEWRTELVVGLQDQEAEAIDKLIDKSLYDITDVQFIVDPVIVDLPKLKYDYDHEILQIVQQRICEGFTIKDCFIPHSDILPKGATVITMHGNPRIIYVEGQMQFWVLDCYINGDMTVDYFWREIKDVIA